jgi:hypothetical protein
MLSFFVSEPVAKGGVRAGAFALFTAVALDSARIAGSKIKPEEYKV